MIPDDLIGHIVCADCLEIMPTIPDKSVDMILCDLPYGTTACKWDIVIPFNKLWEQYNRIIKDNGAVVLFGNEPFASQLRMSNIKNYKYDWIWDKGSHSNPLLANKQPLRVYENICVFYKNQPKYYPQMVQGTPYKKNYGYEKHSTDSFGKTVLIDHDNFTGLKYPKNIISIGQNKNNRDAQHPTQKPVALFEYLIKTYTLPNDIVLDNCSGSGTTAIACLNTMRQFICIEKDPEYWKASCERLEQAQRQQTLF